MDQPAAKSERAKIWQVTLTVTGGHLDNGEFFCSTHIEAAQAPYQDAAEHWRELMQAVIIAAADELRKSS